MTPLAAAALQGRARLVRLLRSHGASPAFVDEHAFRALNLREMLDSDVVLALDLK
jgi:hypothetical protein